MVRMPPASRAVTVASALGVSALLLAGLTACSDKGSQPDASRSRGGQASPTYPTSPPGGDGAGGDGSPSPSAPATGSPSSPPGSSTSLRDGVKALAAAEKAVPHGTVYRLQYDDDGVREWQVRVAARGGQEWEVRVADDGGRVTDRRPASAPDDVDRLARAHVSAREAVLLASGRHGGAELREVELDVDREGRRVWQVTTADGIAPDERQHRTLYDARTGKLVEDALDD